jgi:phosphate transport system substrate-binding protein
MFKTTTKIVAAFAAVATLIGAGSAIAGPKGRLTIKGSDTILPLSQRWAEEYMGRNRDAMISVTGGGSGVGLASLASGACDIANASREAKSSEIQSARQRNKMMVATPVARDGIAIIVNPDNHIKTLSIDQLKAIYLGARNWKQFGGRDKTIVTCGRDSSSGTYGFFQEKVLGGRNYRSDMITQPSNNAICQMVSQDAGAIGYVGLAYAKKLAERGKVRVVAISKGKGSAIEATDETVLSGKYPLWRYLYCYTAGKPSGVAADFLKFAVGPEGQKIAEEVGYVRLK